MGESKLIRKIQMSCPICDKTHEIEGRIRLEKVTIKDEEVEYEQRYLFCRNADEEDSVFVTGLMNNENLQRARNAYRKKHGLLTSDEIVGIREGYGLSQVDLARLLGWGEATISRYESKAIQDEAYDTMLRLIKDNPLKALELFRRNLTDCSESKKYDIRIKIGEKIDSYGKEYLTRQTLEGEYVDYGEPSDSNGFVVLNIDKTEAAISYIAERVNNLYKVKLMKMLWYTDSLSYKLYGHAMTGLVYRHDEMGALPIGHYSLMNLENLNVREELSKDYNLMIHIFPTRGMDYGVLSSKDKRVLNAVISKFNAYKAKEIVDYMHKERAYIETESGDIIPFTLAKTIRDFD